jgi:multidrug resistance efflux pump
MPTGRSASITDAEALEAQLIERASAQQSTAQLHQSQSSVLTLDPLVAQRQGRAAAIANAQYNYDECRVYAPFDARVTNLVISEGAYLRMAGGAFGGPKFQLEARQISFSSDKPARVTESCADFHAEDY